MIVENCGEMFVSGEDEIDLEKSILKSLRAEYKKLGLREFKYMQGIAGHYADFGLLKNGEIAKNHDYISYDIFSVVLIEKKKYKCINRNDAEYLEEMFRRLHIKLSKSNKRKFRAWAKQNEHTDSIYKRSKDEDIDRTFLRLLN